MMKYLIKSLIHSFNNKFFNFPFFWTRIKWMTKPKNQPSDLQSTVILLITPSNQLMLHIHKKVK